MFVLFGLVWFGLVWFGLVWFGLVWVGLVWLGLVWFGLVWFGLVWFGLVWFGLVWFGLVWFGLVWFGLVWFGLVWFGLVWFGLVWFGLVWFGLGENEQKNNMLTLTLQFYSIILGYGLMIQSAVIGNSVSLPCNIRSNITNDTTELVLWYRDTWESPIYKMDTRATNKNSNLHSAYKDRAFFNNKAEPAFLKIDSVREEDGGTYRCRVDFRKQRTINRKIKLVVVSKGSSGELANLVLEGTIDGKRDREKLGVMKSRIGQELETWEMQKGKLKIIVCGTALLSNFGSKMTPNDDDESFQQSANINNMRRPQKASTLPSKPIITNANGEKLTGTVGPYNEGSTAIFICSVENGKPSPTVTWWLNNEMKDNTSEEMKNGIVKNTFVFENISRESDEQTLKCESSNIKTVFKVATIRLTLNFKPKNVSITSGRTPLSAGVSAKFRCRTSGSRPPADITWWKGSVRMTDTKQQILISDNYNESYTTTIGSLTFVPTLQDNGKYLSCRASNAAISQSAIEDGWKIIVYYVPKANLHIKKLKQEYIVEGDDVSFECTIDANPYITDVKWTFNGRTIRENEENGYQIKDLTLYISEVDASHMGDYVCLASNSQGTGSSNPVTLLIRYSPICAYNTTIVYGSSVNELVNINCEVKANPNKVSFRWWKNTSSLVENLSNFRENYSSSIARYSVRTEEDYGFLYCSGSNDVGSQQLPCVFHIIKAGNLALYFFNHIKEALFGG
ncbi:Neural cell adhesion molecule 2 [Nymphon striatum]|nr:Neural cell adhesion molecule 2 [Nymphon striatum]